MVSMDNLFLEHNSHWQTPQQFLENDPHLFQLKKLKYIHTPTLLQKLPRDAGIYALSGGCLTGKTTLIKQWMGELLAENVSPQHIIFFSGQLIKDYRSLTNELQKRLGNTQPGMMQYVFLDDVTDIHHWEKAVRSAADAGWLDRVVLVLVSVDSGIRKTLRMHFPDSSETHFHLNPLTFPQCIALKYPQTAMEDVDLFAAFNDYLLHGGFLAAINDVATQGYISDSTLKNYSDKLCAEILKQGRNEVFLREILAAIITHYSSQITWNMLSQELSIDHPKTIGDYLALLESFDAVYVQYALLEDTLKPAPKKARKLIFCDPFIFHAINAWLHPGKDHCKTQIKATLADSELSSKIVEGCVTAHYRLYYPTYYIKAEGEIDLAFIYDNL